MKRKLQIKEIYYQACPVKEEAKKEEPEDNVLIQFIIKKIKEESNKRFNILNN